MKSFLQFWDQMNGGKPYTTGLAPPPKYLLGDYYKDMSSSPLNYGSEKDSAWQLQPMDTEDMASYAADDVLNWYKVHGQNNTKLGEPMSDEEFKRHHGITW